MKDVVIENPKHLEQVKEVMAKHGADSLHVLADFDRTLTEASVPSLIFLLYNGAYLSPEYNRAAKMLEGEYRPMENDESIPFDVRWNAMDTWWRKHSALLIASGLNIKDIKRVVSSDGVHLREGVAEMLGFLRLHNIPLVIMSSSGLGVDGIRLYLEHAGLMYDNIYIISNVYEWDENGFAVSLREPIIHVFAKHETVLRDYPAVFEAVHNRKNVILLGDGVDDLGMVKGFDYDNLITVGFLNSEVSANLERYKKSFDVVLIDDAPITYVHKLLTEIVQ